MFWSHVSVFFQVFNLNNFLSFPSPKYHKSEFRKDIMVSEEILLNLEAEIGSVMVLEGTLLNLEFEIGSIMSDPPQVPYLIYKKQTNKTICLLLSTQCLSSVCPENLVAATEESKFLQAAKQKVPALLSK